MYSRITSSSRPTVETKYPRAQKCCPTKFRFLPKVSFQYQQTFPNTSSLGQAFQQSPSSLDRANLSLLIQAAYPIFEFHSSNHPDSRTHASVAQFFSAIHAICPTALRSFRCGMDSIGLLVRIIMWILRLHVIKRHQIARPPTSAGIQLCSRLWICWRPAPSPIRVPEHQHSSPRVPLPPSARNRFIANVSRTTKISRFLAMYTPSALRDDIVRPDHVILTLPTTVT